MRLFEYIEQGGTIMYLLLFLNIVGMTLLLWRIFVILDARKNMRLITDQILTNFKQIIGEHQDGPVAVNILKDEVQSNVHRLEFGLNTIKIIASIAPLLGLLGTVLGILSEFKVISEQGMSNPSLFAGGIAMALVTTVGGLIVAIPHFVGYNYLVGLLDDMEIQLEKQAVTDLYGKK